jgi:putative transposase
MYHAGVSPLFLPGGTYFFTVVTQDRRPILTTPKGRVLLRQAIQTVKRKQPFEMVAIVLLPDHLHAVWTLPPRDDSYSLRWAQIKEQFTRSFIASGGDEAALTASRERHRERGVWQRRFWEHSCRDDDDLNRCVDYVHWNPVKHGLVKRVKDYPWSTFHRFVKEGEYDLDWGGTDPAPDAVGPGWE